MSWTEEVEGRFVLSDVIVETKTVGDKSEEIFPNRSSYQDSVLHLLAAEQTDERVAKALIERYTDYTNLGEAK